MKPRIITKTTLAIALALVFGGFAATAHATQYSIMPALTPPSADEITDGPGSSYELGTRFQTDVDGQILALRYWQPQLETGSHVGNLWTNGGTLLESVTFAAAAPGWNQATLATPVNITAGSIYIVSSNINVYYPDTDQGLAASIVNGPIHSVVGNDGLYSTTPGNVPDSQFDNSNYYRDVVFQPTVTVPEPASLATLLVASAMFLRRKRKTGPAA